MTSILLVVHVMAAVSIVGLVLMQQGKGADMGAAFGGGSQTLFGARGSANFLSRVTGLLAAVFFVTSLTLAYIYGQATQPQSVTDQVITTPAQDAGQTAGQAAEESDIPRVPNAGGEQGSSGDIPAAPETETGTETEAEPGKE